MDKGESRGEEGEGWSGPKPTDKGKIGQPRKVRSRPRVGEVKKGDQGCKDSPRLVLEAKRRGVGEGNLGKVG